MKKSVIAASIAVLLSASVSAVAAENTDVVETQVKLEQKMESKHWTPRCKGGSCTDIGF